VSNVVDKREEWIMKLARNVMDLDPETKRQIIRVYPNLTQRDIYAAIVQIRESDKKRKKHD
jgi:hypothetical protein